jgi:transposase
MKQYSADFRERLLRAIDAGLPQAEAARLVGVCVSTIGRWRQRQRSTGSVAPRNRPGRTPRIGADQAAAVQAQVAAQPDATLAQHCARWEATPGVRVSVATMSRVIRRRGITVKQSPARHGAG